ncbi:MAG: hypothetical protein QGF71_03120, partial [Rhodospirillales bacterium]|nr:hypothetical protein [Rhodospirillales bacterium]
MVFTDNSFGATTGFGGDNARIEMFYPGGIGGIIVIRPPKALSWNELLDNPKSVEVIFPAKTGLYVISARTWEYKPKDLPPSMRQIFADLFENKTYKLKLRQGISYWQNANFAKAKPLAAPFKLIGFKDAQNFVFTAGLSPNLFDNLIAKRGGSRKPLPSIYGRAYLPPFKTGFGLSKGTQEIELTLALDKDVVRSELSLEGDCLLQIGSKKVPMRLEIALGNSPVASVPYTNFLMNAYFPGPWKKAFGISGLTLSDVRAGFSLDATSSTWSVALRGTNTIRKKNATLGGTAMFLGGKLPIPASLIMAIDDG